MTNAQHEIFACSVARMSCRMKLYGNADVPTLSMLKVLYKYQEYLWYDPDDTLTVQNDWQHKKKGILLDLERKLIEKCRDICRSAEITESPVKPPSQFIITQNDGIFEDQFEDQFE